MPNNVVTEASTIATTVVLAGSAVVGVVVWITKRFQDLKDELYKVISLNKSDQNKTENRVGILEVKVLNSEKKLDNIEEKAVNIEDKITQMQLENKDNQMAVLTAINAIGN